MTREIKIEPENLINKDALIRCGSGPDYLEIVATPFGGQDCRYGTITGREKLTALKELIE